MHATHDGGERRAKRQREVERRRKPLSTQEVTSHVPASLTAEGGATLRGPWRQSNYGSRNAFQGDGGVLGGPHYTSRRAPVLTGLRTEREISLPPAGTAVWRGRLCHDRAGLGLGLGVGVEQTAALGKAVVCAPALANLGACSSAAHNSFHHQRQSLS